MPPILSIVGKSNSGKTTLIEKLVAELKSRGWKIGTVKHDVHGFDIDIPGKDSWRHRAAGADSVIISSPQKLALIKSVPQELTLDELARHYFPDVDLVITEGYKREAQPKIEIHRRAISQELLCDPGDNLQAVASDTRWEIGIPCFDLNDYKMIADFVEDNFLKKEAKPNPSLKVVVDGKAIDTNEYVQNFFRVTLTAMLGTLEGGQGLQHLRIVVEGNRCPELKVNGQELRRKPFINTLFARSVAGMVSSLRDTEGAQRVEVEINL